MADHVSDYAAHSRWSEPGRFDAALGALPPLPESMPDFCGGLLLHFALAPTRGVLIPEAAQDDAGLRTVEAMLGRIIARDPASLTQSRQAERRFFGSCRQFSLLAAARLRQAGIPARLRVGFADYFRPAHLVDHWVCEYDCGDGWRLLDPELDAESHAQFAIDFPAHDVPRHRFRSAAAAWQDIRAGRIDPSCVGVPDIGAVGLWFAAASLMRDAAALSMQEVQPWDYWGCARAFHPGCTLTSDELVRYDSLAHDLAAEPATLDEARGLVAAHVWIEPTDQVLSFVPFGEPREQSMLST